MNISRLKLLGITLSLAVSAKCGHTQPAWTTNLIARLKCGMTLQELEGLDLKAKVTFRQGEPFVGDYGVSRGELRLWLQFANGQRLESYVLQQPEASHWRLSPRVDVCTGSQSYRLRVVAGAEPILKARIYVDGKEIGTLDKHIDFVLAAGAHELRIEANGYPPFDYNLELGPSDRGDQLFEVRLVNEGGRFRVDLHRMLLK